MTNLKKILHMPAMDSSVNTHESVLELLIDERILVDRLIKAGQVVYGANTLVGHKDGKAADPGSLLNEILKSHLIGFGVSHTAREVAFIARARILSWQAGGTGVSPETYLAFCEHVESMESAVIPKECSYSSGDVIPATHLLDHFLRTADYHASFPSTDIMPFINGNFVQLGYCASIIAAIDDVWLDFSFNSANTAVISQSNPSNFSVLAAAESNLKDLMGFFSQINTCDKPIQDPISIRGTGQYLSNYFNEAMRYLDVLGKLLSVPSGNPLFIDGYGASASQASFLALDLSSALLSMINATKMLLSVIVNRTSFILSGDLEHIPQDMSMQPNELGLIQIPKLLMSIDEKVSLRMPPASAYSAKSTSNGIEDMWNNGQPLANILNELLTEVKSALLIERYVHIYIAHNIPSMAAAMDKMREDAGLSFFHEQSRLFHGQCPLTVLEDGLAAFIENNLFQSPGSLDDVFSLHSIQNKYI